MSSRGRPLERTRSIEDLHELRLMALLHDLVREHQRKGAGEILGLDPRTVGACLERGSLSMWVRTALEGLLLSREQAAMAAQRERIEALEERMEALEQRITNGLGEMRTTMDGEIKALKDEHAGALRQWERRLAQVEAGYGGASAASGVRKPVARVQARRKYPELVTREPAPDDEEVYGAAWPLVEEWRRLREGHPSDGRSLSWLVTEERHPKSGAGYGRGARADPAARDPAAHGGVEERAATLDRGGPGRHPVGADQEGAAQVGAAVLHRGTVVEVGAASSPHHVCCMSASDVGGEAQKVLPTGQWGVILRLLSGFSSVSLP